MTNTTLAPADVEAYEEQWVTTLQAIRTLARISKWSKRVAHDSDPESLRGVITIYARHKDIRQALEIVVLPTEVYAVLNRFDGLGDFHEMGTTEPLRRGALLHVVRRTVDAWRHVRQVGSLEAVVLG